MRMIEGWKTAAVLGLALGASAARADDTGSSIWVSGGASWLENQNETHPGLLLAGGVDFSSDGEEQIPFGFSFHRAFNGANHIRHDILFHLGYFVAPRVRASVLVGVEHIVSKGDRQATYLKPVIGGEAAWEFFYTPRGYLSLVGAYSVSAGSSGSLFLNSGGEGLSASQASLSIAYSFGIPSGARGRDIEATSPKTQP